MHLLLRNVRYRRLFAAQCVALLGTGLATVALGLLAYDLAGASAGAVLGTALAIKMVAYVLVSPLAGALASRVSRRRLMVLADAVRLVVVQLLPWVDQVWQVFVLIAVLQTASAVFTPVLQSVLPDVIPDEDDYTTALSASQFAVSVENVSSPLIAAAALLLMDSSSLFALTAVGFLLSGLLLLRTDVPRPAPTSSQEWFRDRLTRGVRIVVRTPRLRAVLALNAVVASTGVITLVTTVNVARDLLGGSETDVTLLLAAAGVGTASAALVTPRWVARAGERTVMGAGATLAAVVVSSTAVMSLAPAWPAALVLWALIGASAGLISVPIGRLVRAGATPADRPAAFAAQFSLSHACWLVTYPLTGVLITVAGVHDGVGRPGRLGDRVWAPRPSPLAGRPRRDRAAHPRRHGRPGPSGRRGPRRHRRRMGAHPPHRHRRRPCPLARRTGSSPRRAVSRGPTLRGRVRREGRTCIVFWPVWGATTAWSNDRPARTAGPRPRSSSWPRDAPSTPQSRRSTSSSSASRASTPTGSRATCATASTPSSAASEGARSSV